MKFKISMYRESVDRYHNIWYSSALELAGELNVDEKTPRFSKYRSTPPHSSASEYYKNAVTVPLLGKC